MRRIGICSALLCVLLFVGGCGSQAEGREFELLADLPGFKRFDHFSISNMHSAPITATVKIYKEGVATPLTYQDIEISAGNVGGVVLNDAEKSIMVWKVVCSVKIGNTASGTRTIRIVKKPEDPYLYYINSANFFFSGPNRLSGTALMLEKTKGDYSYTSSYYEP